MVNSDEADVAAGSVQEELQKAKKDASEKGKPVTKRQKRKKVNDKHKWPQMPKIQSPEVRAKAYVRVAGLSSESKSDNNKIDLNDPSIRFGRLLGSADQRIRHQAVLKLETYLKQKCQILDDEETDVETGISEMDLLKLWKAMWHTLYMADKVPVQQELSKKLANLIWCVAGTEEEDEYAAKVYLEMYGDDAVGFDEEDLDDKNFTFEEIENTLEEEDDEEDVDEEERMNEDEGDAEEAGEDTVEEDEEREEEVDEENGLEDSDIPHCRGAHLASLFVRTFFHTVRREWGRMDKYRVDKFYSLIRLVMHEVFRYMSLRYWNFGIIRIFNDVLHEEVLSQTPNGLRYHLIDLTLEELAIVNSKSPMPLTEATFLDCLEPYFAMASVDIGDDTVKSRVMGNIIAKFLDEYSVVSEAPAKDGEGNPLTMDQVHVGTVAEQIFTLASSADTTDYDRESLYEMHKRYLRAIKRAGKDVEIKDEEFEVRLPMENCQLAAKTEEESKEGEVDVEKAKAKKKKKSAKKDQPSDKVAETDEVMNPDHRIDDDDVDIPERPRKRKLTGKDSEQEEKHEKTKKKTRESKKKKKDDITERQEGGNKGQNDTKKQLLTQSLVASKGEKALDNKAETSNELMKNKKKTKKNNQDSSVEVSPSNETLSKDDEVTISVADQKAARKAMNTTKTKDVYAGHTKTIDIANSATRGRRVKFGKQNMARSWEASMKGLRTMQSITPLPRPEKGILQQRDSGARAKKAKNVRKKKKASEYF